MRKFMTERDKDGIILYDSTDDAEDSEVTAEEEDIFTDEYMRAFADAEERKIRRMKRIDRIVSVGVIVGIVLFVSLLCWIYF